MVVDTTALIVTLLAVTAALAIPLLMNWYERRKEIAALVQMLWALYAHVDAITWGDYAARKANRSFMDLSRHIRPEWKNDDE